jgi:hypothetical protein
MTPAPKLPTIMEQPSAKVREAARAQWWRINVAKMDVQQLADITGYSTQAIYYMERGISSNGAAVKPWAWQRYKMTCAGVEAYLMQMRRGETPVHFDWGKER